jgi:hypothetical protein
LAPCALKIWAYLGIGCLCSIEFREGTGAGSGGEISNVSDSDSLDARTCHSDERMCRDWIEEY